MAYLAYVFTCQSVADHAPAAGSGGLTIYIDYYVSFVIVTLSLLSARLRLSATGRTTAYMSAPGDYIAACSFSKDDTVLENVWIWSSESFLYSNQ